MRPLGSPASMTDWAGRFQMSQCVIEPSSGCVSSVRTTASRATSSVSPLMRSSGETSSPRPVCVRRKRSSSAIPGEVTRKCGEPFMRSLHDGVRFWLLGIFGMLGIFGLPAAAGV